MVKRLALRGLPIIDQALVSLGSFAYVLAAGRLLPSLELATFFASQSLIYFVHATTYSVLVLPYTAEYVKLKARAALDARAEMALATLLTAVAVAGVSAGGNLIARWSGWVEVAQGALMISVAVVPWSIHETERRAFIVEQRWRFAFILDLVANCILLLAAALLVVGVLPANLWTFAVGYAAAYATSVASAALFGDRTGHIGLPVSLIRATGRRIQAGSIYVTEAWLRWGTSFGSTWIMLAILPASVVADYRAAAHLANVANPLVQLSNSVFGPKLAARWVNRPRTESILTHAWRTRVVQYSSMPLAALALLLVFFSADVVRFAYGDRFGGTNLHLVLPLVLLSYSVSVLRNLAFLMATVAGFPSLVASASIVGFVAQLMAIALFVLVLGVWGSPLGSIAGSLCVATLVVFHVHRRLAPSRT